MWSALRCRLMSMEPHPPIREPEGEPHDHEDRPEDHDAARHLALSEGDIEHETGARRDRERDHPRERLEFLPGRDLGPREQARCDAVELLGIAHDVDACDPPVAHGDGEHREDAGGDIADDDAGQAVHRRFANVELVLGA